MKKPIKEGYYSAIYFLKTAQIIKAERPHDIVTMQFFQRNDNVRLAGVKECLEIIKTQSIEFNKLDIDALSDGSMISANEPVLKITGPYWSFGHLEGVIDGILARQTSIATNAMRVLVAANGKPVIYMNDRNDFYYNQEQDGYAAHIGGMSQFVTAAQFALWSDNPKPIGTMPHALIQAFGGDLVAAANAYMKHFPNDRLVGLVDYHNDVINDSLLLAKHFPNLFAVRLDTSAGMIDHYFDNHKTEYPANEINGVNIHLVRALRKELNAHNFGQVKIIVSSGFDYNRISNFEKMNAPVDIYGVGQALAKITIGFTGDCVLLNGQNQAKAGRININSQRLEKRFK